MSETITRDPRTDPRPGDVLRVGRDERMVSELLPHINGLRWESGSAFSVCYLTTWRSWARKAEVLAWGGEE